LHCSTPCAVQSVDVDELGELAAELGVSSMPTFLFFRWALAASRIELGMLVAT